MLFRNHEEDESRKRDRPQAADPPGSENLNALRLAGMEFLAAGDEAINRVLSGNSEEFLLSNRQQGGQ